MVKLKRGGGSAIAGIKVITFLMITLILMESVK